MADGPNRTKWIIVGMVLGICAIAGGVMAYNGYQARNRAYEKAHPFTQPNPEPPETPLAPATPATPVKP